MPPPGTDGEHAAPLERHLLERDEREERGRPQIGFRLASTDVRTRHAFDRVVDIILTAQPAIPISQIIATIDAARGSFPTVAFGISR